VNPENPINDGLVEPIGRKKPQKSIKMDKSKKKWCSPFNMRFVKELGRIFDNVEPVKIGKHNPMKDMGGSFDKAQAKKKRKRKIAYQSRRINRMRAA